MAINGLKKKIKLNEPNSQKLSVFWLVTEAIHEIRGISPYGDLFSNFGHRGPKNSQNAKEVVFLRVLNIHQKRMKQR